MVKRSAILQPLSREHHHALVLAKACERAAASGQQETIQSACAAALQAFATTLEPHFQQEEDTLLPLLAGASPSPLVQRTRQEHEQLRSLQQRLHEHSASALGDFGKLLAAHVRFEERELFEAIEHALPDART